MQVSEGTVVGVRYRIVRHLGGGGFGQAFLAEDIHSFGEQCVVKKLQPSSPQVLEKARTLFDREGKTLQRLGKHDQIPRLLAYFEEAEEFYLVQEFIPGRDLSRELTPGKKLSEPYARKLLRDVLPILEYVHSEQVIHRDIKPSNIIRPPGGKLVLIDFGAVKQITQRQSHATIIGTPGYTPREQAIGDPNYSSDIYALGMVAIQSLTGMAARDIPRHPDTEEVMWRELASPDLGEALVGILRKMVHPDHRKRYQSATEVLEALAETTTEGYKPTQVITPGYPDAEKTQSGNLEPPEEPSKIGPLSVKPWHAIAGVAGMGVLLLVVEMFYPIARPFYYVRQGRQLLEEFQPEKALVKFENSTDLRDDYREGWKGQGDALLTLGRYERALTAYQRVLLEQNDPKNLNNQGKVLYKLGRKEDALVAHEQAIELDPNNASAWQGKGIALIGMREFDKAIEAFDKAKSISPNDPRVWQAKGIALGYLGRRPEALKVYEEALDSYDKKLEKEPENLTAWVDRGEVLNQLGRPQDALASYEEALKINPQHYPALVAKGNALVRLQEPEKALEAYDEAIESRNTDYLVWYNRGIILSRVLPQKKEEQQEKQEYLQEALKSFERVLQLKSEFYPALKEKGVTLIFLEKYQEALEVFDRAKEINTQDPYLWINRGDALAKLGKTREAKNSYEKALALKLQPDERKQVQQKLENL
ncbi:MAG: tetratricopeptide repeat protein [Hormoscilla sp.]